MVVGGEVRRASHPHLGVRVADDHECSSTASVAELTDWPACVGAEPRLAAVKIERVAGKLLKGR